jgi:predicted double-glycine peptidase
MEFEYLYGASHHSDMELKQYGNKQLADLEREFALFMEMMEMQEKQGFPSKSYLIEKVNILQRKIKMFVSSVC